MRSQLRLMMLGGGAYEGRNITVAYAPFGNDRLNVITDKFNLTVKSEIFEGTFKYIGKIRY